MAVFFYCENPLCLLKMKITIVSVGKVSEPEIKVKTDDYLKRISHDFPVEMVFIKGSEKEDKTQKTSEEAERIKGSLKDGDRVIILDEKGKENDSAQFSKMLEKSINSGPKRIMFIIGGSYGFHKSILESADETISLSKLTFPHQLVRLIIAEQIYRGISIMKGTEYHH
jgi:23S rRNA (pseudouridine1915-N3)-methyltransferase